MENENQPITENLEKTETIVEQKIPKRVFIVPYRNRPQQKFFFQKQMNFVLENETDYEIYFSHQCDSRSFNRGATKNIGFLTVKNKYPQDYQNITFIFNDLDTLPFHKIFDYQTTHGIVKHYYGFKYALGGIVVIKGSDFEMLNGYPNFWGWGSEDNCLQHRCMKQNVFIDRSLFFPIGSPEILQLFDGVSRIISKKDNLRSQQDTGFNGLSSINNLYYKIDGESFNPQDNVFVDLNKNTYYINILNFSTGIPYENEEYYNYDLREPVRKLVNPDKNKRTNKTFVTTDDWKNIPYYPTAQERKEMHKMFYNEKQPYSQGQMQTQMQTQLQPQSQPQYQPQYNHQKNNQQTHQQYQYQQSQQQYKQPPHIYSAEYASYIGIRPRATASVNIGLGGVKK